MKKNHFYRLFLLTTFAAILLFIGCHQDASLSDGSGRYESYQITGDYLNDSSGNGSGNTNGINPQGDNFNTFIENAFIEVTEEPISTFSIDADGASYSYVRRSLHNNTLPPQGAIRTEELINYFTFDYPETSGQHPITLNGEISSCPWADGNKLLQIGIKGATIPDSELPASNFVFLIDVSGSMNNSDKLGLLKESFKLFADELEAEDRIAIVTYAGSAGVVLPSTPGSEKQTIKNAIDDLSSGGSTAGAAGIIKAYEIAEANFISGGNNRVILGTDGDFNVGISDQDELVSLIEEKRASGVFLTVLGVGSGNLQEGKMEQLANNGNGNFEYLDNLEQAKKVFIHEFKKFYTVAKDVKIQIEFNKNVVQAYRLIGYENRLLQNDDFLDDEEDAGEIGSSQTITALYEIIPQPQAQEGVPAITIDFRYKNPDEDTSIPMSLGVEDNSLAFEDASENIRFAASVAGYGMLLFGSEYKGDLTYDQILEWAGDAKNFDPNFYRNEFLDLVLTAKEL